MDNNNEDEVLEFRSVTLVVVPNRLPRYSEGWIPAHRDLCLTDAEIQREDEDEEDEGDIEELEGRRGGDRMELSFEGRRALYEFLGVWDDTDARDEEEEEEEEEDDDGDCEWDEDEDDEDDEDDEEDGKGDGDERGVTVLRCRGQ